MNSVNACSCSRADIKNLVENSEVVIGNLDFTKIPTIDSYTRNVFDKYYETIERHKVESSEIIFSHDKFYKNIFTFKYPNTIHDKSSCTLSCRKFHFDSLNYQEWFEVRQNHIIVLEREGTDFVVMFDFIFDNNQLINGDNVFKNGSTYEEIKQQILEIDANSSEETNYEPFDIEYFLNNQIGVQNFFIIFCTCASSVLTLLLIIFIISKRRKKI